MLVAADSGKFGVGNSYDMIETGTTSVQNLLEIVAHIGKKHEEVSKLTGRDYNIFEILKLSRDEVRLHSGFIGQLLSPKGSHGQGDMYLKLFLQVIEKKISNPKQTIKLDPITTNVEVERFIGKKTETTGGRIDIVCQDRAGNKLIIENKIDAPNQENQLVRYRNYDPEALLIYLNLFGDNPSGESLGEDNTIQDLNLIILTYENDIVRWLEECLKSSYALPVVRESVFQYLNTVRSITNQIENVDMDTEIVNTLVSNGDRMGAALLIQKSIKDAIKELMHRFGNELREQLVSKYGNKTRVELHPDFGRKWCGIRLCPPNSESVFFQLSLFYDYREFYLEIQNLDNVENGVVKKVKDLSNIEFYSEQLNDGCRNLGQIPSTKTAWQGDWVCRYTKIDRYFNDENGWSDLADNNFDICKTVVEEISPIVDAMLERVKGK